MSRTFSMTTMCPHCGVFHDAAEGVSTRNAPVPGAIFICDTCFEIGILTEQLLLRKPEEGEMEARYKVVVMTVLDEIRRMPTGPFSHRSAGRA